MLARGNAFFSDQHKCEEDSMETQFFFGEMSGSDTHDGDFMVINRAKLQQSPAQFFVKSCVVKS